MAQPPRILAGHKQVGKRSVTPFNQLELVKKTRYVEWIMPELLWMDMINYLYDYRHGIETPMSLCSQVPARRATLCDNLFHMSRSGYASDRCLSP